MVHNIYIWYLVVILSAVIATIVRRYSQNVRTIALLILVSLIGFLISNYQIYNQPIHLVISLILYLCVAIVTYFIVRFESK